MNAKVASCFSLSLCSLSVVSWSSVTAAVLVDDVGLGVAVLGCDEVLEVEVEVEVDKGEGEGEEAKEPIEYRVTISQLYFSRKTRYCGPGDESLR